MSDTGTPIDKILAILEDLSQRIAKIEMVLFIPPKPEPEPQKPEGGIYDFKRPAPNSFRHGLGVKMTSADEKEFIERSRYAVRYNGNLSLGPAQEDEAWAEITAIQTGDPGIIKAYADAGIDPMLVAVLLMQGRIDPVKYDGPTFGNAAQKRAALVGQTPGSWLANEFAIMGGGAVVSGGDAPE